MTFRHTRGPRSTARPRFLVRVTASGASALALGTSLLAGPAALAAHADPPSPAPSTQALLAPVPTSPASTAAIVRAQAQVDRLEVAAAALDDQAVGAKVRLDQGTRALQRQQAAVRTQNARVTRLRAQVGQVALARFQGRDLNTTAQLLLTSDATSFLNQIATVQKVSENQNVVLRDYQVQQARLTALERSAQVQVAALRTQSDRLAQLRRASAAKITQSKAVLARLTEQERQRIAAQERAAALAAAKKAAAAAAARAAEAARAAAAAKAAAERTAGETTSRSAGSAPDAAGTSAGSTSSTRAAAAVAYAERQLGKPYVWGAVGPRSYDCSGLTSSAWRSAGVTIPRTALAQSLGAGRPVAKAELQPGDLVFFYHPVSHVAMYVGDGVVIHAPRPGKAVQYIEMSKMPFAGARRPG